MVIVKVGESVPDVSLDEGFPPSKVSLKSLCEGRKIVLMGLPGAFTPTWSNKQIPGYMAKADELKAKGVAEVVVFCVNDGAVMKGWAKDQKTEGTICRLMADTRGEVTGALGVELCHPGPMSVLGTMRCQRFAMIIDNGIIKSIDISAAPNDPAGDDDPSASCVENILSKL